MKTPKHPLLGLSLVEKKSKFYAYAAPFDATSDLQIHLDRTQKKWKKATHHAFAYRRRMKNGIEADESDDGEPSGTAGKPILFLLEKQELLNIIIIVSRIYGGTKLGKGGLTHAYGKAAANLIKNLDFTEII